MSVPDPSPARKPRRLGLYLPFALLLVAAVAWSGVWLWARGQAQARLAQAQANLARAGYQLSWTNSSVGGYPFRLDVTLSDAQVREPSGWGLQAPVLEGEVFVYAADRWIVAAPRGFTFVRPQGGPVRVTGRVLRMSAGDFDKRPPSLSFQALDAVFQPAEGAEPFALTSAGKLELHLRPGPDDEGGVFLRVENGRARLTGLMGRIAGDKPILMVWNSTLSKMSAFLGADWPSAVRAWTDAGGRMTVREAELTAAETQVHVDSGSLGVGGDGRLRGVLQAGLRRAPQALGAMAESGAIPKAAAEAAGAVASARQTGDTARAEISFEAGQTTLGPVALGPAPKVYTPR